VWLCQPGVPVFLHPGVERGQNQLVAGAVPLVDGGKRGARTTGDLAQLHGVVALGFEQLDDDVEDAVLALAVHE
jgi:hypothetical protein